MPGTMSAMAGDLGPILGGGPASPLPIDAEPLKVLMGRWAWADPLAAILRFGGWTIDDVVSDPRAAREVRFLWRLWNEVGRRAAARERRLAVLDLERWRREGLPVPCPLCASRRPCSCPVEIFRPLL